MPTKLTELVQHNLSLISYAILPLNGALQYQNDGNCFILTFLPSENASMRL